MMRRDLDSGDVLVGGEQRQFLGGRDMQHMDALAGGARETQQALGAKPRGFGIAPDGVACGIAGRPRESRSRRRNSSSLWKAARRVIFDRMRATPSSSSTSRSPVDEPMKTLTPAQPGSFSRRGRSSTLSRVPPMKKAKSQCMRLVARRHLVGQRLGRDGRWAWCWASRRRR